MSERISFETEDGAQIIGDYYEGGSDRAALLLHMMPSTKASWVSFANILTRDGFSALAIDLRGHGESTAQNETALDYRVFEDADHQKSRLDLEAAVQFLKRVKHMRHISLVGASIGANLALAHAARDHAVESVILLSPGLLYRGVDAKDAVGKCGSQLRVFFAASAEDEYSAASARELHEDFPGEKQIEMFQDAGHGTAILERKPEFMETLSEWLLQNKNS